MTQVILAKENFFRWIRQSESEGCVPKKTCKFFLWDDAVVGSCTTGHNNPTCEKEWYLSMDLLDWRCGWSRSASLKITAWKKSYFRLHRKDWIS
ncbi:hypothetical protein F5B20DRAFT_529737 [Whalleya microplaca]|nr:hypothetical protein F5B20DRAFT_529737 [Whalleya microplaca]